MGAKGRKKHIRTDGRLDRTLTAPESEAQQWEKRTRAAHQQHESRQRAQGAFRRNAKVDAAMQQLLSTTEDPRGALGLATHYQTHCQWQERPQGGLVRYNGTPDYMASTDEWLDHLQRVLVGWSLDPPPIQAVGARREAVETPDGLQGVDTGALNRARARLLHEEPTLSFVFEACGMARQSQADVGRRLGVQQPAISKQLWKAIRQLRAWMSCDGEGGGQQEEAASA